MANPLFEIRLPYHTRCNLPDCGKSVNRVFRTEMSDGTMCNFCTPSHANTGAKRWEENLAGGVRMDVDKKVDAPDMVDGYIPGNGEDGGE